mmetsp:Transcript_16943/g.40407  ORF Transcript_16943/g.40407 Transcript_16943/m.40407 type:complete len:357 (-) Transcript_16943:511-1581(-)
MGGDSAGGRPRALRQRHRCLRLCRVHGPSLCCGGRPLGHRPDPHRARGGHEALQRRGEDPVRACDQRGDGGAADSGRVKAGAAKERRPAPGNAAGGGGGPRAASDRGCRGPAAVSAAERDQREPYVAHEPRRDTESVTTELRGAAAGRDAGGPRRAHGARRLGHATEQAPLRRGARHEGPRHAPAPQGRLPAQEPLVPADDAHSDLPAEAPPHLQERRTRGAGYRLEPPAAALVRRYGQRAREPSGEREPPRDRDLRPERPPKQPPRSRGGSEGGRRCGNACHRAQPARGPDVLPEHRGPDRGHCLDAGRAAWRGRLRQGLCRAQPAHWGADGREGAAAQHGQRRERREQAPPAGA